MGVIRRKMNGKEIILEDTWRGIHFFGVLEDRY